MDNFANKVKIYILDISNKPFDLKKIDLLEEKRKENILTAKNYLYRLRSLYAGLLLRHVLLQEGQSISTPIVMEYNESGKPYIKGGKFFSISHSGNVVIVAVSDVEIGIDAEIKQNKVYAHIASKVLSEVEFSQYEKLYGEEKIRYFLSHWVTKEAYLKCNGTGIKKYPSNVEVSSDNVNGYKYNLIEKDCKNYSYFISTVCRGNFETELVHVTSLKVI